MSHQELEEFKQQLLQLAINNAYMLVIAINYNKDEYTVLHSTTHFIDTDQEGVYSLFSIGYLAMFHPDDILNYPLLSDFDTLIDHLSNNNGSYTFEFRFQNALMKYNWYEGTYVKLSSPEGFDNNLLLLIKDIDDKKSIEENLRDALAASIVSSKSKTNFFSRMSHDIRTPLNLIADMTNIIKQNMDDNEKIIESLDKIEVSSKYLTQLINNVLDMSDIEAGNILIANTPFNLLDQINSIEFIYSELAKSKGIHFSMNLDIKNHSNVIGDQARISQVLNDLLSNTFKYVPTGSEISFDVILDKIVYNRAYYTFIIEYNSDLVDDEFQDVILHSFTQEAILQEEVFNEASIALSLCKNIVELLGGHISATPNEHAKGVRSEVNISFELPTESDFINVPTSSVKAVDTFSRKNVLVVDSNYSNYGTIKSLLQRRGITVELAINGLDAIEIFEKSKPHYYDLILMDIEMPIMTGFDAAKAIRNSFHDQSQTIPIIAMTSNKFAEDLALSISVGINDYILKPVDANKLFSVLNNYI